MASKFLKIWFFQIRDVEAQAEAGSDYFLRKLKRKHFDERARSELRSVRFWKNWKRKQYYCSFLFLFIFQAQQKIDLL